MNDVSDKKKLNDLEVSAVAVSATIVVFFVVYWVLQIKSTFELLSMAYGW